MTSSTTKGKETKLKEIEVIFRARVVVNDFEPVRLMDDIYNLPQIRVINPSWKGIEINEINELERTKQ